MDRRKFLKAAGVAPASHVLGKVPGLSDAVAGGVEGIVAGEANLALSLATTRLLGAYGFLIGEMEKWSGRFYRDAIPEEEPGPDESFVKALDRENYKRTQIPGVQKATERSVEKIERMR